ncbi:MAG: ABC transporter substrate-binding protein, partial [Chitinophagaceae bacterium]|nr:ABC transporter substrate-binding protein [Chitinophagaceae bacterium]
ALQQNKEKEIQVIVEDGGNAADSDETVGKANKLLLQDRVDAVIAYTGAKTHEGLSNLFDKYKKILVLADWGAYMTYDLKYSDYVFHHTMNEWVASYSLGRHMAEQGHKKILFCLSLMDVGYHLAYAFLRGTEEGGGSAIGYHTAKLNTDPAFYAELEQKINEWQPDTIYCGFAGDDADKFWQNAGEMIINKELAVAGPGLLTLPEILEKYKPSTTGITTSSAWYPALSNELNTTFLEDYRKATGNEADRFSVLGYECGMALLNAASYNENGFLDVKNTASNIKNNTINSPRGEVRYDPEKNYTVANSYLAKINNDGKEIVTDTIHADMEKWRKDNLEAHPNEGWLNPYPCT